MTDQPEGLPDGSPEYVTFEEAARLLASMNIAPGITGDGIRYIARTRKDWPFGDAGAGRPYTYVKVANARTMRTEALVQFFRDNPLSGRGPDQKPRKRRGDVS